MELARQLTMAFALVLLASTSLCLGLSGEEDADNGPVEGVTLVLDFGDAKAPHHRGNLSEWKFDAVGGETGGEVNDTGDAEYTFTSSANDGRSVYVFRNLPSRHGTVLGVTEAAATVADLSIGTETYSYGGFVDDIGGAEGARDGKNWFFWVNGEYGTLASDRTGVEDGDVVLWRYMDPDDVDSGSGDLSEVGVP